MLCGSFAYGYTEKACPSLVILWTCSVSVADVYSLSTRPDWYLEMFEPCAEWKQNMIPPYFAIHQLEFVALGTLVFMER